MNNLLTIAQASDEVGIAKEVLRKWEVRYGFPIPLRDKQGKRAYAQEQLGRLKLIKKLLNEGYRPAQVVPMQEPELNALLLSRQNTQAFAGEADPALKVVEWLKQRDPAFLRSQLSNELRRQGLLGFARDFMPRMNEHVGQAWQDGTIAVRDEHIYSEIVQGLIREALAQCVTSHGTPRVLLTTPTGEAHSLGILMLEALLSLENAYCISLGPQSPLNEIVSAATEFQADIVALSFSIAFPKKKIPALLRELRAQLPPQIKLWAGGAGTFGVEPKPRGVTFLATLPEALDSLNMYRNQSLRQLSHSGT